MTDPVNEQHMRAMGLDASILGLRARALEHNTDRCASMYGEARCARLVDHAGKHARGQTTWGEDVDSPLETPRDELVEAVMGMLQECFYEVQSDIADREERYYSIEHYYDTAVKVVDLMAPEV